MSLFKTVVLLTLRMAWRAPGPCAAQTCHHSCCTRQKTKRGRGMSVQKLGPIYKALCTNSNTENTPEDTRQCLLGNFKNRICRAVLTTYLLQQQFLIPTCKSINRGMRDRLGQHVGTTQRALGSEHLHLTFF